MVKNVSRDFSPANLLFILYFGGGGGIRILGLSLYFNRLVIHAVKLLPNSKHNPGCTLQKIERVLSSLFAKEAGPTICLTMQDYA